MPPVSSEEREKNPGALHNALVPAKLMALCISCTCSGKVSHMSESSARPTRQLILPPNFAVIHADIPPSPDNTSGEANSADYTSPGTHPSNDEGFEPDLDNASEAVKRNASGSREVTI